MGTAAAPRCRWRSEGGMRASPSPRARSCARALAVLLGAALAPELAGCFVVSDLGRFHAGSGGEAAGETDDPTLPSSLVLSLGGMSVHRGQMVEFRVVDQRNYLQCRGILA